MKRILLSLIIPSVLVFGSWLLLIFPSYYIWFASGLLLSTTFFLLIIFFKSKLDISKYLFIATNFLLSMVFYSSILFLQDNLFIMLLQSGIFCAFFIYNYFFFQKDFNNYDDKKSFFLINYFVSYIIIFLATYSLYSFAFFLDVKMWFLLPILAIFLIYFWLSLILKNEYDSKKNTYSFIAILIIGLEFFYALSILPSIYYVNTIVFSVITYILSLYYEFFYKKGTKKSYFVIASIAVVLMLVLIMATVQWS